MQRGPLIFLGVFATFLFGWLGLVFYPQYQLNALKPETPEGSTDSYPRPLDGLAAQGLKVYISEGCVYCHSQQVRADAFGTDIARGWGDRRSVPRDYIYENPVLLGTMRTGPDLANIGARQADETWHYLHLYNPQITSPGSIMPPYRYLFDDRKISGEPSISAIKLKDEWAPPEGREVIPTDRAKALVAYLKAQNRNEPLKEANR
jgi:cytochrome c oxidase cbb3-type subunit 2